MTSEHDYRNAVRYLQNLLNGGLMGARGTSPLMTAIEACELQIPKHPISKSWSPNLCPHCNADLGGDCNDGYYENPHYDRCPVCGQRLDYSFNCLIKTDASLVKGSLSESYGETELLANLYGKIICIEDDANGMSPTETVPTPVDVFDIILGYREASELISFAEDMKKRALHAALETARYALKKWDKDGISIQSSLEKCFCTIPMGSTEAYNLSCATDILSNHPSSEACELFYNGIEWKCYPDDTELNDVIAHPEQYIVIPVLFSDK